MSISIHVPRAGYDARASDPVANYPGISIHVPRAGYDEMTYAEWEKWVNFYPRTPCGVRLRPRLGEHVRDNISIHVPRAGYDFGTTARRA